jgi:hypothetical protein
VNVAGHQLPPLETRKPPDFGRLRVAGLDRFAS